VGNPRVRVKLRDGLRARWYTGTAHLLSTMIHANAKGGSRISAEQRQQCRRSPPLWYSTAHGSIDLDA